MCKIKEVGWTNNYFLKTWQKTGSFIYFTRWRDFELKEANYNDQSFKDFAGKREPVNLICPLPLCQLSAKLWTKPNSPLRTSTCVVIQDFILYFCCPSVRNGVNWPTNSQHQLQRISKQDFCTWTCHKFKKKNSLIIATFQQKLLFKKQQQQQKKKPPAVGQWIHIQHCPMEKSQVYHHSSWYQLLCVCVWQKDSYKHGLISISHKPIPWTVALIISFIHSPRSF